MNRRARWYHAVHGRFASVDPFPGTSTVPASLHPYAYTHNDPITFTDPLGLYRCDRGALFGWFDSDAAKKYQTFCDDMRFQLVVNDRVFRAKEADSLGALLHLFAASFLPGGADAEKQGFRQADLSALAERLDFVLWLTHTPGSLAPVHFGIKFKDTGFREEFRDGKYWPDSANQVGHFLTAVHMGVTPDDAEGVGYLSCLIGHEKLGDNAAGNAQQCLATTPADLILFLQAVDQDIAGDTTSRDCYLRTILKDLPADPRDDDSRDGNSMEDLRLSLKGWIFGSHVRNKKITTLEGGRSWLATNLR